MCFVSWSKIIAPWFRSWRIVVFAVPWFAHRIELLAPVLVLHNNQPNRPEWHVKRSICHSTSMILWTNSMLVTIL
jgi:hypothetical protein